MAATARHIYFAGSIRGGRTDAELYGRIINHLQRYGTVLTEHVGDPNLKEEGTCTYELSCTALALRTTA